MAENGTFYDDEGFFDWKVTPAEQAEALAVRASIDPDDEDHAVEAEGFGKDYGNDVYPPGFDDQYDIDEEA